MRYSPTLMIVMLLPIILFGQQDRNRLQQNQNRLKEVLQVVDNNREILRNWNVNETKEYHGVNVLRMSGKNGDFDRTNIAYIPSPGNFYPAKLALFFDRNRPQLADVSLFTIKIVDTETEDVYLLRSFDQREPYCYKKDVWYNYVTVNIPPNFSPSLTVEIIDAGLEKDYKFLIYNIPVEQVPPSKDIVTQTRR